MKAETLARLVAEGRVYSRNGRLTLKEEKPSRPPRHVAEEEEARDPRLAMIGVVCAVFYVLKLVLIVL